MKKTSRELKLLARKMLMGKYGISIGAAMLISLLMFAAVMVAYFIMLIMFMGVGLGNFDTSIDGAASVGFIVMTVIMIFLVIVIVYSVQSVAMAGLIRLYLNMCKGQSYGLSDLTFGLKNYFWKFIVCQLLFSLIGLAAVLPYLISIVFMVWMDFSAAVVFFSLFLYLCYIIIFLAVCIRYAFVFFILVEDPEKGVLQAFRECSRMMQGNKKRLVFLCLSFFGMLLLGYCTFGIGWLWVGPYFACTLVYFYLDIRENQGDA